MKPFVVLAPLLESLPNKWKVATLQRVSKLIEEVNAGGSATLLSLTSAGQLVIRAEDHQPPSSEYLLRYGLIQPGDLVVNPMWLAGGGIGVSGSFGAVSPEYRVYRLQGDLVPRYIHHVVRSDAYLCQYRLMVRAETTFDRRVTKDDFREIPLPIPPLITQRAIADYLDAETARIDALIEKKRRMVELLEERWRSAAVQRLTTLIDENGAMQLRRLVRCLDGRRIPLSTEERAERQGPYPYYGASNVVDYVDDYLFDEDLVLVGEDGAQLGDPSYPISQRVSGKIWVNNHAHVLKSAFVDLDLLVFHLNTFDRVPYMSGATREKITQEDLRRIPFPSLALDEQRVEATMLLEIRCECDLSIAAITRQIDLLLEHRRALITAAVTGELEIPGVAA